MAFGHPLLDFLKIEKSTVILGLSLQQEHCCIYYFFYGSRHMLGKLCDKFSKGKS